MSLASQRHYSHGPALHLYWNVTASAEFSHNHSCPIKCLCLSVHCWPSTYSTVRQKPSPRWQILPELGLLQCYSNRLCDWRCCYELFVPVESVIVTRTPPPTLCRHGTLTRFQASTSRLPNSFGILPLMVQPPNSPDMQRSAWTTLYC